MTKLILIISISLLLAALIFMKLNQKSSLLETVLNRWLSDPEAYQNLSEIDKNIREQKVNAKTEAEAICRGLEYLKAQFGAGNYSNLNENLYTLAVLFQQVNSKKAYHVLNERGIPLLLANFNLYRTASKEVIDKDSFYEPDIFILKIFAKYDNPEGTKALIDAIKSNYKPDAYLWSIILEIAADTEKYPAIIEELGDFLPSQFAGISYLDMCNRLAIDGKISKHPFDNEPGYQLLKKFLQSKNEDEYSYAVSATATLPFIQGKYRPELLKLASGHPDVDVRIEASWSGAKLGDEESLHRLIEFAKDYRYGNKPLQYLKELGKEKMAPAETKEDHFQALAEMCNWLSHPNEYGKYPDEAFIFDKRQLYWPPTKDNRTMYIIKYTYKNYNDDGSDDTGVGLVGSITFSLFGVEGLTEYSPEEIYAVYCAWEMGLDDYDQPETGLKILRKYNQNL